MRRAILTVICILTVLLTGCWDAVDIEERAYVIGVAIDEYPPIPEGHESENKDPDSKQERILERDTEVDTGKPIYAMTIQLPVIKLGTLPNAQGGGSAEQGTPKTWEITQAGNSFMEMNRTIATRVNLKPYYEHLQVIVISDKVAKKGLKNVLDFFIRDHEMRSRTKVFIIEGEAKKVLDIVPRIEDYSSIYLAKMVSNAKVSAKMIHWTDLGKAVQSIYSEQDFALPRIKISVDEVMNKGAAIFKGDKMIGWIDGSDVEAGKMMRNLTKGGILTARMPGHKDSIMTLEIAKAKSKVTPLIQGNTVTFKIDLDIKGNYVENVNCTFEKEIDQDFVEEACKTFEESMQSQCKQTIEKVQNMGADIFLFGTILETQKPSYWEKVKDKWHDVFPHVKTEVNVKVSINQIGNIR